MLAGILAAYVVLCGATAATRRIVPNEGWFADAAYHLAAKGYLGTTILDSSATWLEGIDRRTYWVLPLHLLGEAATYRVFGFSLWTTRAYSLAWGLVALLAWFFIVRSLAGRGLALLVALVIATDYHFVVAGSHGRMDMMCAALGFSGIAAYLCLRARSLPAAVLAGNGLVAAACFTHPCGLLHFAGLVALMFWLDRGLFRWKIAGLALLPYVAGAAGYGLYILADPHLFVRQFLGNVSGLAGEASDTTRFGGLTAPLSALRREFLDRYIAAFGTGGDWYDPYRLQGFVLLAYGGGVIVALLDARLRNRWATRVLLLLAGISSAMLCLLEGLKLKLYLVHTIPILAALAVLWFQDWTGGRRRLRALLVAAMVCIQVIAIGEGVVQNSYRNEFLSAVDYLKSHARPDSPIIGSGEFGFAFGFDRNLKDDVRLGYFTGKTPEFFVKNAWYEEWLKAAQTHDPPIYRHVRDTLRARYREVFRNSAYTVYQLRETPAAAAAR